MNGRMPEEARYTMKNKTIGVCLAVGVILLSGCGAARDLPGGNAVVAQTETGPGVNAEGNEEKELFRYVSKEHFYTDFEGESVVQTDEEDACTICQRSLRGELTDSYYMGRNFAGIFYVDEDWLYYSELDDVEPDSDGIDWDEVSDSESLYRVPLLRQKGKETPEFSKKEFLFTEPEGFTNSDFTENSFLQLTDDTIYYHAGGGLGTYNLKTRKRKFYPVRDREEEYMKAAGTKYMIAEGEKQCDVLTDLTTGKSEVMKTDRHPWLRLGREFYFRFPYSPFTTGSILLDLNSGEALEVLSQEEGERVAKEMAVPWDKEWLEADGWEWDGISIEYIGYYNHRVYAEIQYPTMVKDKKGREIPFRDAVCVSRNMDEEKGWTVEREITSHARREILKYYKQVGEGSYKIEKDEDGEIEEYEVEIGEGIANGIFYFEGIYKKDGKLAIDIYDLKERELRVIGRNSPETFYPLYDNGHGMMDSMHAWQSVRELVPVLSQAEALWDQEQKRIQG